MLTQDPQALMLLTLTLQSFFASPTLPSTVRGDYIAAPNAEASKHASVSVASREIRTATLSCKPLDLHGSSARAQGRFSCASITPDGALSGPVVVRLRLRRLPNGTLEIAGLDGIDKTFSFLPSTAAGPKPF